jgi:hypothetical protein
MRLRVVDSKLFLPARYQLEPQHAATLWRCRMFRRETLHPSRQRAPGADRLRSVKPASRIVAILTALFGVIGPVSAQQPSQAQIGAIRQACRADYPVHCAGVPTGGAPALACLQQNVASLSPACQQAVNAVGAGPRPAAAPAPADQAPAGPAAAAPAVPPAASPAPAEAATRPIRPTKAQRGMIRQTCRADYRALCADVTPGRGARLKCLRDNAASLSAECQQALAAAIQGVPAQSAAPPTAPQPPAAGAPEAAPPANLSPREELFLLRSACGADFRNYCRGLPLGGGRIIGCLRDNAASLSPRCQRALTALRGAR